MFGLFGQCLDLLKHNSVPNIRDLWVLIIDLPFVLLLARKKFPVIRLNGPFIKRNILQVILALILIFIFMLLVFRDGTPFKLKKNIFIGSREIFIRYGLIGEQAMDYMYSTPSKYLQSLSPVGCLISEKSRYDHPNIISIQVESLDAKMINYEYKGRYVMPYLNDLAKNNIYFPFVLSYHRGGGTSDTEFSILNSIEPLDDFPAIKIDNYFYPNSLIKRLAAGGYNCVAFHGNFGNFWNRRAAFDKIGFNQYYDLVKMDLKETGWGATDKAVFGWASNYLNKTKKPFFSLIITMSSHYPFDVSKYYHNKYFDSSEDQTSKNYMNSISYVDDQIKGFVKSISRIKNTYIFIYGDHWSGTPFSLGYDINDNYFGFVPLVVITPDHKKYYERKKIVSFLDFAPSLLNISGVGYTIRSPGSDIFKNEEGWRPVLSKTIYYDRAYLFRMCTAKLPHAVP
jgi:phosphoglycerol transferase MdoB-like AlkP superfamily enzyme